MDTNQGIAIGGYLSAATAIFALVVRLNHQRIRSKCCNRDCVTSLDVEETTPQTSTKDLKITIPKE